MLTVENFSCLYAGRGVFAPVSFTVSPREVVVLRGSNGIGKTTLLRALAGLPVEYTGKFTVSACHSRENGNPHFKNTFCYTLKKTITPDVIPAQAGIQNYLKRLDSRLRGNDKYNISETFSIHPVYIPYTPPPHPPPTAF